MRIVWQTVRRIANLILGVKGLRKAQSVRRILEFYFSTEILFNIQLRTATRAQDYESSAFKAHDEEDYRKVWLCHVSVRALVILPYVNNFWELKVFIP